MNRILLFITATSLSLLSACGSGQTRTDTVYTRQEFNKMTYCIGMSDTAMHAATSKLKGVPKDELTSYYATRESANLNTATVDKVYSDNFTSVWDYSISFFEGCAENLAHVPVERVNRASKCAQNSQIAGVAYTYKTYGTPKQKAYEHFKVFGNKSSNDIVDEVYDSPYSRADIKLDIWTSCMSKITGD